jgi:DNA transposition AAA+ family ATPase
MTASAEIAGFTATDGPSSFCPTMPSARLILDMLERCRNESALGAIIGAPGVGKTTSFHHFAHADSHRHRADEEYPGRRVHIFTPTPLHERATKFIIGMAAAWGQYQSRPDSGLAYDYIALHLGPGSLLIVDEAQRVDDRALDVVRALYDATGCGVVISGNPEALSSEGSRTTRRLRNAPLISRATQRVELPGLIMPDDLDAYCDHHRVQGARARTLLEKQVDEIFGLRRVARIVAAARAASGASKPLELKHIEGAIAALGLHR